MTPALRKPAIEAQESWDLAQEREGLPTADQHDRRNLKHHHHHKKAEEKRKALLGQLYDHPGIHNGRVHGMMIDAGSTGSRLHIYEWKPRILRSHGDVEAVAGGDKLSYPDTHTRWTDRLTPGLSTFHSIADENELVEQVAEYFRPLLDFARTVLHAKENAWETYPIYLRATAGMRTLEREQRARVMKAVRKVFSNSTISPFLFDNDEQARVISGEEEAVFDWTAVNFLMGNLVSQTEGTGTVRPSIETHGALDLGGASTQISFYEPDEDVMSNFFKLQIGQSKHWNIYAHSFLFYGMNEAIHRFGARLVGKSTIGNNTDGTSIVRNPCLQVGSTVETQTWINVDSGIETWASNEKTFTMTNSEVDLDLCFNRVRELLHLPENSWCEFAHRGDCSLAGVYQPQLPQNSEFVAFSNFALVWTILNLPESSSVDELGAAARKFCATPPPDADPSDCFRGVYAYELLRSGYGFAPTQRVRAVRVVAGQHVGWALGAMLYEINTLPWHYEEERETNFVAIIVVAMCAFLALWCVIAEREQRLRRWYQPIKNVEERNLVR